jgi:hypothetical protein
MRYSQPEPSAGSGPAEETRWGGPIGPPRTRVFPYTTQSTVRYHASATQFCRKAAIGIGMPKAVAAPPIPFSQVVGGNVHPVPFPWQPAAQNM